VYNELDNFIFDSPPEKINFCIKCGSKVEFNLPTDGDENKRFICTKCNFVHYQNPKIVVGTLSVHNNKILLCKRAIQPQKNKWTLPAGFMENGETSVNGAWRETFEEACAKVNITKIFSLMNIPKAMQVHIFYLADFDGNHATSSESLETQLFAIDEIPWDELAFNSVYYTLKNYISYIQSNKASELPFHSTIKFNNIVNT